MSTKGNRAVVGALAALMLGAVACTGSSTTSTIASTPPATTSKAGLYAVNIGTGDATLFLEPTEGASEFALDPKGDRIAFEAKGADGHPQIFVMNSDGSDQRQLTHELAARLPAWSPDGARIAFVGLAPDETPEIYVFDVASGESNRITRESQDVEGAPAWSPDGETIAFQVGEPPVVRSTDMRGASTTIVKDAGLPDISPDGSRLAFNTWSMAKVTLADIDGSDRTIIRTDSEMYNANWSPNGERIAFQSYPEADVYIYEPATGKRRGVGSGDIVDWLDDQTLLVLV